MGSYTKRFVGYCATHFRVRLKASKFGGAQLRYRDATVEIQIASVLMHAWAEVEHDLVYKPLQGELSNDEYSILDEINGVVIALELTLERLQKAGEARVAAGNREFGNHYELAAHLLDKAAPILRVATDSALGRVDLLYVLIELLGLATPEKVDKYIGAVSGDTERRPLAEQIVDQVLAEDPSRYKIYDAIKSSQVSGRTDSPDEAVGRFINKWITFERLLMNVVENHIPTFSPSMPSAGLLERLQVADAITRKDIDILRRIRNNLVHGIETPDPPFLMEASERLDAVIEVLRGLPENQD